MIIINDLFKFKPFNFNIEFEEDKDNFYLNLLSTTSDSCYYEHGLYFVYKYYINKFFFPLNEKLKCINILKDNFLRNPKWYTYDILKYIILDLDYKLLIEIFNNEGLLSLFIGEYLLRNEKEFKFDDTLNFAFYISIPFYFYKKKCPSCEDIRTIFLFPDKIDSEYKIQYYLCNFEEYYKIDIYTIKLRRYESFASNNPYTNYLLFKHNYNTCIKKSQELMILLYENIDFIVEGSIYSDIIKKYHNILDYKYNTSDISNINNKIQEDIINKHCLVDHKFDKLKNFEIICKEYKFSDLVRNKDIWDIEYILNLEEIYFNIFINYKKEFTFYWKSKKIEGEIIKLIKEYHTSTLMTKKYRENLYKNINEHKYKEIFELYLKRGILNRANDFFEEESEFLISDKNIVKDNDYLKNKSNEIKKDPFFTKDTVYKRYKLSNSKKIQKEEKINIDINLEASKNIRLSQLVKLPLYKKIFKKDIIFYEYIEIKYKSTNYKFIKYLREDKAKDEISDLIKYNLNLLDKITKKGIKLKDHEFLELIDRLKKEGDHKKLIIIFNILNRFNYKFDVLIYEDLDFKGRNKILEYIRIENKRDFIKLLIILNNEDNTRLVIKILNIIKENSKYFDIIEIYKKNIKFQKLMVRVYPLIGYDDFYKELCGKYKFKEELDILNKYYNL